VVTLFKNVHFIQILSTCKIDLWMAVPMSCHVLPAASAAHGNVLGRLCFVCLSVIGPNFDMP